MLILTRKSGERIFIGENIEICVTVISIENGRLTLGIEAENIEICIAIISVEKGQVRIGIEADKNLPILREEVYVRMNKGQMGHNIDPEEE